MMTEMNVLPFGPRDSAVDRQEIVDTLHRMLDGHAQLDEFPDNLKLACEHRIWERERIFPGGTRQGPILLDRFVRELYPVGLGASFDTIERLIGGRPDVLAVWTEVTKRPQGQRTDLVYNVHDVADRPAGNTAAAGLRKPQKAAAEGNEAAVMQLAEATGGRKSVHAACVDAGLRKPTRIDPDVRARCQQAVAEWIVGHAGPREAVPSGSR